MTITQTVNNYLSQKSVKFDMLAHRHTGSSHETAQASHVNEDHIAKAVIVKDSGGYVMVVIPASNWVDMERLNEELGREFKLVPEAELDTLFSDCESGAIPPLGPAYQLETVLDENLVSLANVYFEAGDHEHLVHTTGEDFQSLLGGVRHGYFSHDDA